MGSTSTAFSQLWMTLPTSSSVTEPMQDTTGIRVLFSAPPMNSSSILIDMPTPSDNWRQHQQLFLIMFQCWSTYTIKKQYNEHFWIPASLNYVLLVLTSLKLLSSKNRLLLATTNPAASSRPKNCRGALHAELWDSNAGWGFYCI